MKTKQKMTIKLVYFITSILVFGSAISQEVRTMRREDIGEDVFFYRAPNKTDILQIQPRIGEGLRDPRQRSYPAARNFYKPIVTDKTSQSKSIVEDFPKVPILIYRGPHRPRELYHFKEEPEIEQNPNYFGASSKQVIVNRSSRRNNRFQSSNSKGRKRNSNNPAQSTHLHKTLAKNLYEDISILQEPHVERTNRPSSPEYYVPEKQNYAIYAGGRYADGDTDTENHRFKYNSGGITSSTDYKTTYRAAPRSRYGLEKNSYGPNEKSNNGNTKSGYGRQSSNANRQRTYYSRNYHLKDFTPSSLSNGHPGHQTYVENQFKGMDHYDEGVGFQKHKRENPGIYHGADNFGIELDYENYDTYIRPIPRYHRASKSQPEYDGDLNFDGHSSFEAPIRALQNGNRTVRRNKNGRQRRRKGHTTTTSVGSDVNPTQSDYEGQANQADFQQNTKIYEDHQSPDRVPDKIQPERHDTYATSAAIEDTYANVEIRRTQPKTTSKSSRSSGRILRQMTTRATNYPRYLR